MKNRSIATDYERFAEDIVPHRFILRRESEKLIFLFNIDGYRGRDTGEIYYSPLAKEKMDKIIQEFEGTYGKMLSFSIPNVLPVRSNFSTTISASLENASDTSEIDFHPASVKT